LGFNTFARLADMLSSFVPYAESSACPNIRWRKKAVCDAACVSLCPTRALTITDTVAIDPSRCISCNVCATSCPQGVFTPRVPSDAALRDIVLSARKKGRKGVRFSCDRCGGRYGRPRRRPVRGVEIIALPCLGSLSEALPLYAMRMGLRVDVDPCSEDCRFPEGRECHKLAMNRLEDVLGSYVMKTYGPSGAADDSKLAGLERRKFLLFAGENIARTLLNLESLREEGPVRGLYAQSVPSRRRELLLLTHGLVSKAKTVGPREYPILDIRIDGAACDLCEICSKLCPTGALVYDEEGGSGSMSFSLGMCTGCWLCKEVCPKGCILTSNAPLGNLNAGPAVLVKKRIIRCKRCNFKYLRDARVSDRQSCPICDKKRQFRAI